MKTIEKHWLSFREHCIPTEASDHQVLDLRAAFYGGATVCLGVLKADAKNGPSRNGLEFIAGIDAELDDFATSLPSMFAAIIKNAAPSEPQAVRANMQVVLDGEEIMMQFPERVAAFSIGPEAAEELAAVLQKLAADVRNARAQRS